MCYLVFSLIIVLSLSWYMSFYSSVPCISSNSGYYYTKLLLCWCSKGPVLKSFMRELRLLKTMMFLESFGFYKMCLKSWYLQLETKKICAFFQVFCDSLFFLEIFTTFLTMQCTKCLFQMYNHIDQVRCVTFVEKVSRQNSASKNIYKEST